MASLLYAGAGLSIGFLFYFSNSIATKKAKRPHFSQIIVLGFVSFMLLNWLLNIFKNHYNDFKIGLYFADMLPMIQVMCDRFLSGREVYEKVPEVYNAKPPYLPGLWLPYLIPVSIKQDLRWTNIFCLIFALIIPLFYTIKSNASFLHKAFIFITITIFNQIIVAGGIQYVLQTEEAVVLFYYALLALSIYVWNPYFIGIVVGFCLLSRYMLLFWFAVFCFTMLTQKEYRTFAVKIILSSFITGFILMLVSGSLGKIGYFMSIPNDYIKIFEDRSLDIETYTLSLKNTIGLRRYFVEIPFRNYLNGIMLLNILLPIVLFVLKRKSLNNKWMVIGTAKICLTVFLATVIHPFEYLFYTNVMVSIVAITLLMNDLELNEQ